MKSLSRNEMKNVKGGSKPVGGGNGDGSCTYTLPCSTGSVSCTSESGDCAWVTAQDIKIGVCCDNKDYDC